jgi:hypothetical protein
MVDAANTSDRSSTEELRCAQCGATVSSSARNCWLCHTPVVSANGRQNSANAGSKPERVATASEPTGGFSLSALMMFVTLVSVVLGVSTIAPGIGIPFGVILFVVWLRTAAVAQRRRERGVMVTRGDMLEGFFRSLGMAVVLLILTCVAGCAAFFAACLACAGVYDTGGESLGWTVFTIVAAAIAIPVLVWMGRLIHRRWRRDIGEPNKGKP